VPQNPTLGSAKPADVVLSPDGSRIYAAGADGWIRVYDASTGGQVDSWHVGTTLGGMDISPDGSFLMVTERAPLATNGGYYDRVLTIGAYKVSTATGAATTYATTARGLDYTFYDVAVLSNGQALFSQDFSGSGFVSLKVLTLSTGAFTAGYSVGQDSSLTRSGDGSKVLIGEANNSGGPLDIYTAGTGVTAHAGANGFNWGIQALSANGSLVAQYIYNEGVNIYDGALNPVIKLDTLYPSWSGGDVLGLAFDASGANLYVLNSETDTIDQLSTTDWHLVRSIALGFDAGPWIGQVGRNGDDRLRLDPTGHFFTVITAEGLRMVADPDAPAFEGTAGADMLTGTAFDDTLNGLDGDDRLVGGSGNDQLSGGAGDDDLRGGAGVDTFDGGSDDGLENPNSGYGDRVDFYERAATQAVTADLRTGAISNDGFGNAETMTGIESLGPGTRFADTFYGNDGRNFLWGSLGDTLYGFGGDDIIYLDSKPQSVDGGDGVDELRLGTGGGWLTADLNGDGVADIAAASTVGWRVSLQGHYIAENVSGAIRTTLAGIENVTGSALSDVLIGDDGANVLKGGDSRDQLLGNGGNDRLEGGAGSDIIYGDAGDDQLVGGDGDDALHDGPGVDSFDGGAHDGANPVFFIADQLDFDDPDTTSGVIADLRSGIVSNDGYGNVETMVGIESLYADNPFADTLYGDDGMNLLLGAGGDSLYGFGGDDWIELGAAGNVDGGAGWDKLLVFTEGLFAMFDPNAPGTRIDAPEMATGWTINLATGVLIDGYGNTGTITGIEQVWGSHLADFITGDSLDNRLEGDSGNDVFDLSAGGNDYVHGGIGNDYFYFGATFTADDTVDARQQSDNDTVGLLGNYNLTLGANTLLGVETLSLLSGTAAGGTEHVTYSITTVDANVPAGGRLTVYAGGLLADETLFFNGYAETNGALSVYGGAGNDTFAGGPANDAFVGGAGDDTMYGLGGMDWLEGGLGADTMRGGPGNDLVVYQSAAESTAAKTDRILDFEYVSDHIDLTRIDANSSAGGDQAFSFIGSTAFSHTAGELRAYQSGASWFVEGDVNGDGNADLVIQVDSVGGHPLIASDFLL
jgi:Ca2+-binding RTX toxin-like protein